ncbi:MAG: LCP family protein [Bacillota bacterium]|nr:LCP family protein [Bacillota bacterium]
MRKITAFFKYALVAGIIFGACFAIGAGSTHFLLQHQGENLADDGEESTIIDGERTNILFLGVDARPGETNSRSDTMIFASIDPKLKKVAVVSIPRDTRIDVPGSPLDKICTANMVGGPEMAVSKVEELLGTEIKYYVEMDFNGFEDIIDTLGGVEIDVQERMYKPSEGIDLYAGQQQLDGHDALAFVRYRDYVFGDIDRTSHQQEFIKALAQEVLKAKTVVKLLALAKQANKYIDTNMGLGDMVKMASWAPGFNSESIYSQTLPGYFFDETDSNGTLLQSYWVADLSLLGDLIDNTFEGKTVAAMVNVPVSYTNKVVKQVEPLESEDEEDTDEEDPEETRETQTASNDDERNWERSRLPSPGHGVGI